MKRTTFLKTLTGGLLAFPLLARAETPEEKNLYDVLDAALDAQFRNDFQQLVTFLHPGSVRMFRNILSARFDQLVKLFPVESVLKVANLPVHPKDFNQTDNGFFVFACEQAKKLKADFVGDPNNLPFKIHGTIFEGNATAYVVYSYSGNIRTTRTDFDYIQPLNLTLRKENGHWLIFSSFLAQRVADLWWTKLSKPTA